MIENGAIATDDAARAADARTLCGERLPAALRFSTDTRTLAPGDTFVALRGERFEGHAYLREALVRGAVAVVVSDPSAVPDGVPALVVADTTRAYLAFAAVARRARGARVVAITGSTGKTTTKTLLAQLLREATHGLVVATPENENNEIGVAKLLLGLPAEARFVVVECGARHYGDIEPLVYAALPEVAVLTNVGDAHLEIMGSRERLADTKWGIFATGAQPVLGAADAVSRARSSTLARPPIWFSTASGSDLPHVDGGRRVVLARAAGDDELVVIDDGATGGRVRRYPTHVAIPGAHNRANVAAAVAAACALGIEPAALAAALPALQPVAGRYERIAVGDFEIVYDAYNASADGTIATLESFARENAGRRIAVLGSMAELGAEAPRMHERVGKAAAKSGLGALLVGGDFAADLARGAYAAGLAEGAVVPFACNGAAVDWLRANARPGDLVLLKASRRYRLEEILEGLRATYA